MELDLDLVGGMCVAGMQKGGRRVGCVWWGLGGSWKLKAGMCWVVGVGCMGGGLGGGMRVGSAACQGLLCLKRDQFWAFCVRHCPW